MRCLSCDLVVVEMTSFWTRFVLQDLVRRSCENFEGVIEILLSLKQQLHFHPNSDLFSENMRFSISSCVDWLRALSILRLLSFLVRCVIATLSLAASSVHTLIRVIDHREILFDACRARLRAVVDTRLVRRAVLTINVIWAVARYPVFGTPSLFSSFSLFFTHVTLSQPRPHSAWCFGSVSLRLL